MSDDEPVLLHQPRSAQVIRVVVVVSGCLSVIAMVVAALMPSLGSRDLGDRSFCAANLRGIALSMNVYASDNAGMFPVMAYAPYSTALNNASGNAGAMTVDDTISGYYHAPTPQAGSVQACLWILVLRGDVAPKQFICRTDPFARSLGHIMDTKGKYFDNFQNGRQLSYSMSYPWKEDGSVGNWWKATEDASLPVMADMTPEQGTGTPKRDLTPSVLPKDRFTWNSGNHEGEGQTVTFADGHADFARGPNAGQNNDNIYSTSRTPSTGPAQFGGIPAGKHPFSLTADHAPFDTVMVPVRNETTGGM